MSRIPVQPARKQGEAKRSLTTIKSKIEKKLPVAVFFTCFRPIKDFLFAGDLLPVQTCL
jgi:hypothetical protein